MCKKKKGLFLWIKAQPITGRTHQIRVHLSDSQCPIVGDPWYGRKEEKMANRLFLHGEKIQFKHPQTQQDCVIHCPVPKEFHDFWDQIKT